MVGSVTFIAWFVGRTFIENLVTTQNGRKSLNADAKCPSHSVKVSFTCNLKPFFVIFGRQEIASGIVQLLGIHYSCPCIHTR